MEPNLWYYKNSNLENGPFSVLEMIHFLRLGVIKKETLVRNNLMGYFIRLDSSLIMSLQFNSALQAPKAKRQKNFTIPRYKFALKIKSLISKFLKSKHDTFESTHDKAQNNDLRINTVFLPEVEFE